MTTVMPGRVYGTPRRLSRLILSWDARDQSLVARSGQIGTFARASVGTAFDSAGRLRQLVHSQPRFEWVDVDGDGSREAPTLLLEGAARTNVVVSPRDLTNGAWAMTNMTPAKDQVGLDGLPNTASSLLATAANAIAQQSITHSSALSCLSAYVRRKTGTGVIQMTLDAVTWTAIAVTSAWTRVTIPTQTIANLTVGFRIVTSGDAIAVDWVQTENGSAPSSVVVGARAADALSFPFNARPQAMTVYHDAMWNVAPQGGTNWTAWAIGPGATPYIAGRLDGTLLAAATTYDNGSGPVGSQTSNAVGYGHRCEIRSVLQLDGTVIAGLAVDGGAETIAAVSSADALPAAWSSAILQIGTEGSQPGLFGLRSLKIAAGVRSLAFMRAAG